MPSSYESEEALDLQIWQFTENEADTVQNDHVGVASSLPSLKNATLFMKGFIQATGDQYPELRKILSIYMDFEKEIERTDLIYQVFKESDSSDPKYQSWRRQLVNNAMVDLEKNGSVYLRGGFRNTDYKGQGMGSHAAYYKIYKENGKTYLVDYNAGAESYSAPDRKKVWSVHTREFKGTDAELKELIAIRYDKRILQHPNRKEYEALRRREKSILDNRCVTVEERSHAEPPQGKGNCSSRSLREVCRDTLPPELFTEYMRYIREASKEDIRNDIKDYDKGVPATPRITVPEVQATPRQIHATPRREFPGAVVREDSVKQPQAKEARGAAPSPARTDPKQPYPGALLNPEYFERRDKSKVDAEVEPSLTTTKSLTVKVATTEYNIGKILEMFITKYARADQVATFLEEGKIPDGGFKYPNGDVLKIKSVSCHADPVYAERIKIRAQELGIGLCETKDLATQMKQSAQEKASEVKSSKPQSVAPQQDPEEDQHRPSQQ